MFYYAAKTHRYERYVDTERKREGERQGRGYVEDKNVLFMQIS